MSATRSDGEVVVGVNPEDLPGEAELAVTEEEAGAACYESAEAYSESQS